MTKTDTAKKEKRLVLFDAHAILHRAYHALPEFSSSKGEPTGALYGLSTMLIRIIGELKPDYMAACFDLPKPTYRHEAYKEYKAGRPKADQELVSQIKRARDVFKAFAIPGYEKEGFEADDLLGTIVEKLKKNADVEIIIASGDMDTLQLVSGKKVRVYTLKKGLNDTILYDEKAVEARFGFGPELLPDYKGLRGDPSDNIIGVPGIGEKTATILIKNFGTVEALYKKLKKDSQAVIAVGVTPRMVEILKLHEEEALFSKELALIRRDAPINFSLPEKPWREMLNFAETVKLFSELEFRALGARLKAVLEGTAGQPEKAGKKGENGTIPTPVGAAPSQLSLESPVPAVSPLELKKAAVALWLVNSNLTNPTLDDIMNFSGAKDFASADRAIFSELDKRDLRRVFEEIELPLIPIVAAMKERGVGIDTLRLEELSKEYHRTLLSLEKKIWKQAGEEFNVNSPKQLGAVLFEKLGLKAARQKKTSTGALSTKESELEKLREGNPIIGDILEYRELSKLLGTYIDSIPSQVGNDGRLHADFLQAGTTTGRMGCENPNLQNIPNKTELGRNIRRAFVAAENFKLAAFDYSQVELRIAAFLSGDAKLIQIFKQGIDVHTAVAAEVFGVPGDKVHPDMRRKAKVINFGVMYGMGVNALRANLGAGTSREEAQKFYNDYFEKFSGLARYLEDVKTAARRAGFTETFFGRRRYFPGITSKLPFIKASAERMAINAPIQGTEADIIKLAMIHADRYIEQARLRGKVHLLLQVHDELVYEVSASAIPKFVAAMKPIMEGVIDSKKTKGVVCAVEARIGENWGEMKPLG